MKPFLTNEYVGRSGVKYLFEYFDCDDFNVLPQDKISQCYAIAFHGDKFLIVNNTAKAGQYTPVGGTVEPGENPDETLKREIQEESNMKVTSFRPIGYQLVSDTTGVQKPYYQLRYFAIVEPIGPFIADPAGKVTEIVHCTKEDYKKYFDWGKIGDRIIERAMEFYEEYYSR